MATAIKSGVKTVAATAAALSTAQECNWLRLIGPLSNAEVAVGPSTVTLTTGFLLMPGQILELGSCDLGDVYVIGTAGDIVAWIAGYTG
jgi:hypothetical protein